MADDDSDAVTEEAAPTAVAHSHRELDEEKLDKDAIEVWLDENFEPVFFELRYIMMIPVLISFLGSVIMYGVGTYDTIKAASHFLASGNFGGEGVILPLIKALDAFLLGIILTIFSFGVYDFFVSKLEPADHAGIRPDWLKFESIGELKNKIIEVVLVILAILFFEQMQAHAGTWEDPILYLIIPSGAAILAISLGFFKWATE